MAFGSLQALLLCGVTHRLRGETLTIRSAHPLVLHLILIWCSMSSASRMSQWDVPATSRKVEQEISRLQAEIAALNTLRKARVREGIRKLTVHSDADVGQTTEGREKCHAR